jgi:hypothetical protein
LKKEHLYSIRSQAASKAFDNCRISSRLVWDSHQSREILTECNEVYLLLVPGCKRIEGKRTAYQLAIKGIQHLFVRLEPSCGITGSCRLCYEDWCAGEHHKHSQSSPGQIHANSFLAGPSAKRTIEFLKLSMFQERQMTGLLAGHCHLRGRLLKLEKVNSPICSRSHHETATASHILCDCKALVELRFYQLGMYF